MKCAPSLSPSQTSLIASIFWPSNSSRSGNLLQPDADVIFVFAGEIRFHQLAVELRSAFATKVGNERVGKPPIGIRQSGADTGS